MSTVHRNLTGADLHEPKGADTATSGQVYVADGAGSGSWVAASTIITNTAFTTGDTKLTLKTTADSGWILGSNGSIGDGSSVATIRASSDCEDLFLLLWNTQSNTNAPVSGGRGASAALDFAAHKRITLPDYWGRALGIAGAGSVTTRTLGTIAGAETVTLVTANLPGHTHSGNTGTQSADHTHNSNDGVAKNGTSGGGGAFLSMWHGGNTLSATTGVSVNHFHTITTDNGTGTSTPVSTVPAMNFLNLMIKL